MGIQVIQDDVPLGRVRIAFNQTSEVCQAVFLRAGWAPRGFDHLPGHHIEVDKPGQRPMPDVLKLASEHMTRLHRQVRLFALQRLYSCHLIHAYRALTLLGPLRRTPIQLTAFDNLLVAAADQVLCLTNTGNGAVAAPFFEQITRMSWRDLRERCLASRVRPRSLCLSPG